MQNSTHEKSVLWIFSNISTKNAKYLFFSNIISIYTQQHNIFCIVLQIFSAYRQIFLSLNYQLLCERAWNTRSDYKEIYNFELIWTFFLLNLSVFITTLICLDFFDKIHIHVQWIERYNIWFQNSTPKGEIFDLFLFG